MTGDRPARIVNVVAPWLQRLPLARWKGVGAAYILSTGRTGTLRLAQVVARATESVLALHEPSPDLFDIGQAVARGELTGADAARAVRRARQPICNRVRLLGVDAYVESNNNAAYLPDAIRTVFDAPRFVHVVRDGRATVRSLFSNPTPSRRPGQRTLFMEPDDHRRRLAAVDFVDEPWAAAWPGLSRFERVCWHWAKKNAMIRNALADREDTVVVRFEDVFDAGAGFPGFWEMLAFLGLEPRLALSRAEVNDLLGERTNRASRYLLPPPDEWPARLKESFDRIAGDEHRRYYG